MTDDQSPEPHEAPTETGPPLPTSPPEGVRSRRRPSLVQMLVAGNVALGVVALLLALMVFAPSAAPIKLGTARTADQTDEIKTVAARFARNLLTIDYRTVDADFAAMRKDATGAMIQKLTALVNVVRDPYRKSRSISKGRVTAVEVLSQTEDTSQVNVSASVVIQNVERPKPRTLTRTVGITLVKTVAGWKVSDADASGPT